MSARGAALIRLEGAQARRCGRKKVAIAQGLIGAAAHSVADGDRLFEAVRNGALFAGRDLNVWRVALPPAEAPRVIKALNPELWLGDLAGGSLWVGTVPAAAANIRTLAAKADGHAMLLRAGAATRASLGLYAPQPPALAMMARNVKAAFDPQNLFNPGRL